VKRGSGKRAFTEEDAERDRIAIQRAHADVWSQRILGLIGVGHSVAHVVQVGKHHGTWTEDDVRAVLRKHQITPPPPPFGGGARPGPSAKVVELTEVQVDVLREMCTGAGIETIGTRLWISKPTVHRHVSAICAALDAEDRAMAIALVLTGRVRIALPRPIS
jgi:DNA-binding NarL/FixJ family response regulator